MFRRLAMLALGLASVAALPACYSPGGAIMPYTGGAYTYYSYEMKPKTVRVVDLRTNEVVFSMDIPPGKQLTMDFVTGKGDDPIYTPDLMRYEVFDMGTKIGKLHNVMTVPSAANRRIDVTLREGPEYITAPPERTLRTDEMEDRPDWWTPAGGELPEDQKGLKNYDG
jgi:hypothetical protein